MATSVKRQKHGGRVRGTPNKVTSTLRAFITEIVNENRESLREDINSLESRDRVTILLKLMEFVLPKKKAVTLIEDELNEI